MSPAGEWNVKKEQAGFRLVRPRPSVLAATVSIYIAASEAGRWRASVTTILQRVRKGRFHALPLSLALRCMLGCWRRSVREVRYLGRLGRRSHHVVSLGGSMYLVTTLGDPAAFPISQNELEKIEAQLA
jgi:hypothetical protein